MQSWGLETSNLLSSLCDLPTAQGPLPGQKHWRSSCQSQEAQPGHSLKPRACPPGFPPISLYHLARRPSSYPCPSCAISRLGTSSARADVGAAMVDQVLELLSPELEPLLTWMMVIATLCRSPREKGSKQRRPGEDLILFQFCRSSDQGPEHRAEGAQQGGNAAIPP